MFSEAKKFGRRHLALAYLEGHQPCEVTPAYAQAGLDLRSDDYRHAGEVK